MKSFKSSVFLFFTTSFLLFGSNAFAVVSGNLNVKGRVIAPACKLAVENAVVDFETNSVTGVLINFTNKSEEEIAKFTRKLTLNVTNCFTRTNPQITISGKRYASNSQYFVNPEGDEYAQGVGFVIYGKQEKDTTTKTISKKDTTQFPVTIADPLVGEGSFYLDIEMFSVTSTAPTPGKIDIPVTATIVSP